MWKGSDLLDKSINDYFSRKKRGKKRHIIFYIILAIIILAIVVPIIHPIRRTDEALCRYLFNITPIGTSMEDVISIVEGKNHWTATVKENHGVVFYPRSMYPVNQSPSTSGDSRVIGQQSVRVHLGTYYGIFRTYVSAFYAFDKNEELIDIFIRREHDLL